jgi:hypothetical protein
MVPSSKNALIVDVMSMQFLGCIATLTAIARTSLDQMPPQF